MASGEVEEVDGRWVEVDVESVLERSVELADVVGKTEGLSSKTCLNSR